MPKKVIINLLTMVAVFGGSIAGSRWIDSHFHLNGCFFPFVAASLSTFVIAFLVVLISALPGAANKINLSIRQRLLVAIILCILLSAIFAGPAGFLGAVNGAIATHRLFRGAL